MIIIIYRSQMLELLQLSTIIARKSKSNNILELYSLKQLDDSIERDSVVSILKFMKTQSGGNVEFISLLAKKVRGKMRLYDIVEINKQSIDYPRYDCYSIDWFLGGI
jgi:hypothetical protein